jgi:hypothetical protein
MYSQNLAINPGFEVWQKINKPSGWTTALGCSKDSVVILSGSYSCRQAATTDSRELGQVIPVTGGSRYRVSFWYRNESASAGNGCRIWSNWKDAEGNPLDDETSLPLLHSGYLKSDTWKQYSAEVTSPSTASCLNLTIRTLPNTVTLWDDIVFEESMPTNRDEVSRDEILIYPNPASNYLNINNIHNMQFIEIQTVTGIKLWSSRINSEESLLVPLSGFKDGIYIISILGSGGKRYSSRFLKIDF